MFDALVFGYYNGDRLMYAGRTRNGFTPIVRQQVFKKEWNRAEPQIKACELGLLSRLHDDFRGARKMFGSPRLQPAGLSAQGS